MRNGVDGLFSVPTKHREASHKVCGALASFNGKQSRFTKGGLINPSVG